MSTIIQTVNIGGIDDRRVALANCGIARVLSIGTSWTKLRVGFRLCASDLGGTPHQYCEMYMGILAAPSANLANGPLSDTTSHFLGVGNTQYMERGVSGNPYFGGTLGIKKKIGSTLTVATAVNWRISAAPTVARSLVVVEITKGSPNFTVQSLVSSTGSGFPVDISAALMKTVMEYDTLANALAFMDPTYGDWITTNQTTAISEATNGFFDSVCFATLRDNPIYYLHDIVWRKMA